MHKLRLVFARWLVGSFARWLASSFAFQWLTSASHEVSISIAQQ